MLRQNYSKSEYAAIRKLVRKHTLINSRVALEKRALLSGKQVLMGGIVVKKQGMALVLCDKDNEQYQARCAVPTERAQQEFEKQVLAGGNPVLEGGGSDLWIYDFSGVFKVWGTLGDCDREARRRMYQLRTGDAVFIAGMFVSLNSPEGYMVIPGQFYSQSEIEFYRDVCPERYDACWEELTQIKKTPFMEPREHALHNARSPWDIVRLCLRSQHDMSSVDYWMLTDAAYNTYLETKDIHAARAVLKYYLISNQMTEAFARSEGMEFEFNEDDFFNSYPELRGLLEWPTNG